MADKLHPTNPDVAEEITTDFKNSCEIKTVVRESNNIKGFSDQEVPVANEQLDYKPKEFILNNEFIILRAPEQKKSKKGTLYFNCVLEQGGQRVSLPAKGLVGKMLREAGFREYKGKTKNSAYSIKLVFEYHTNYYFKEKKEYNTLGITDMYEPNDELVKLTEEVKKELAAKKKAK